MAIGIITLSAALMKFAREHNAIVLDVFVTALLRLIPSLIFDSILDKFPKLCVITFQKSQNCQGHAKPVP